MPWNEGACGRQTDSNGIYTKTYSSCRFTQSLQATPQIFQVQPRAGHTLPGETSVDNKGAKTSVAPGDEIVVSGRLCFGDTVDNTLKDSEGNLLMPGDEYQEVLNEVISRDYVPSSTNNDKELRQAALGMMSRVSLGPDFSCELRTRSDEDDEEGLLYPAPNEAVKYGKLQDSPSRGGINRSIGVRTTIVRTLRSCAASQTTSPRASTPSTSSTAGASRAPLRPTATASTPDGRSTGGGMGGPVQRLNQD